VKTALVFNSGSSSLKFGFYRAGDGPLKNLLHGAAELTSQQSGQGRARLRVIAGDYEESTDINAARQDEIVPLVASLLEKRQLPEPDVVGHRIVHGGPHVRSHCLINRRVMACLEAAGTYAPLHNTTSLAVVHTSAELFPSAVQAACLDTAFHASLPEVARVLPLTRELQFEGIERYGFHGLSCESIVAQLSDDLPARLVIAHLGNGASVTAVRNGHSVDTSMGLTPAGGIPMSTRCGDIDPGVLIYLLREKKYDADRLEEIFNHRSGLLGISRLSSDMRTLRAAAKQDADAALAINIFCHGVRKQIAAMAAVLEGIDLLVFTGGIGEHDAETRGQICEGLAWAGLCRPRVEVLPAGEEVQIARHALHLLGGGEGL
jgi:acetate kinase